MSTLLATVERNPLRQLKLWLDDATARGLKEPNAMALATATRTGQPSVRIVLCKGLDDGGLYFYTNYESRKALELDTNPVAAVVFHWAELARQVRLEGRVVRAADSVSDAYFASRPRGSQIGAWTSPQSRPIPSFQSLGDLYDRRSHAFGAEAAVTRPPFWGGYRLEPELCEFWHGMPSRLHDRVRCARAGAGAGPGARWEWEQVAP